MTSFASVIRRSLPNTVLSHSLHPLEERRGSEHHGAFVIGYFFCDSAAPPHLLESSHLSGNVLCEIQEVAVLSPLAKPRPFSFMHNSDV